MSAADCASFYKKLLHKKVKIPSANAYILLDKDPEIHWRLSSPVSVVELGQFPVFIVRNKDWILAERVFSQGHSVAVRRGVVDEEMVRDMLECSKDQKIYISEAQNDDKELFQKDKHRCVQRKRLFENGTIYELVCINVLCIKNGVPCNPFDGSKIILNLRCQGMLKRPSIVHVNFESITKLEPLTLNFNSSTLKSSSVCCQNQSIYTKYLGQECQTLFDKPNTPMMENSRNHNFTEFFSLYPCGETNLQDVSQFLKIPNLRCVIQNHFITVCDQETPINACDLKNLDCENVIR